MHELAIDDIEQVSGGHSSASTLPKGIAIVIDDPVLVPSPGPVVPALS